MDRLRCRDICPILKDPAALTAVIDLFEDHVRKNHQQLDLIVGKKPSIQSSLLVLCAHLHMRVYTHMYDTYSPYIIGWCPEPEEKGFRYFGIFRLRTTTKERVSAHTPP